MENAIVSQLFAGKVKKLGDPNAVKSVDRVWETGIFKEPILDRLWLSKLGLKGDEVGDKKNHGGLEKALFAYPVQHYAYWQQELTTAAMVIGGMGENIAVKFGDEQTVCLGDTYQLGEAIIQVSQPRQPCWRPARRYRILDLALRIQESGRTGWYYRVLKEGYVASGEELILLARPYPEWTITACNEAMHLHKEDLELSASLENCPFLAESWKQTLQKRLAGQHPITERRVFGPNKE